MAAFAAALTVEKLLAFLSVAGDLVSDVCIRLTIRSAVRRQLNLQLQKLADVVDIVLRQARKAWHTSLRTAVLDYRTDLFILFVMEHSDGPHQIWRLASARILTVAAAAVLLVQRGTLGSRGRIGSRDAELFAPEFRPMESGTLADQEPFTASCVVAPAAIASSRNRSCTYCSAPQKRSGSRVGSGSSSKIGRGSDISHSTNDRKSHEQGSH